MSLRYTRVVFCFLLIFFLFQAIVNVIIHFINNLNDFVKGRCIDAVFRREFTRIEWFAGRREKRRLVQVSESHHRRTRVFSVMSYHCPGLI